MGNDQVQTLARRAGLDWDFSQEKQPYACYDQLEFDIPVGPLGRIVTIVRLYTSRRDAEPERGFASDPQALNASLLQLHQANPGMAGRRRERRRWRPRAGGGGSRRRAAQLSALIEENPGGCVCRWRFSPGKLLGGIWRAKFPGIRREPGGATRRRRDPPKRGFEDLSEWVRTSPTCS